MHALRRHRRAGGARPAGGARGDRRGAAPDHPRVLRGRVAQPFLGTGLLRHQRRRRPSAPERRQELDHVGRPGRLLRMVEPAAGRRWSEHHLAGACRCARPEGRRHVRWAGVARQRLQPGHGHRRRRVPQRHARRGRPRRPAHVWDRAALVRLYDRGHVGWSYGGRHPGRRRARDPRPARAPGRIAGRAGDHPRLSGPDARARRPSASAPGRHLGHHRGGAGGRHASGAGGQGVRRGGRHRGHRSGHAGVRRGRVPQGGRGRACLPGREAATVMAPTTDMLYDFIGRVLCGIDLFA
jgi:hypothetical protein